MGLMDDIKDKAGELAKSPDNQAKAEDFAKQHNISVEEAKKRLFGGDK